MNAPGSLKGLGRPTLGDSALNLGTKAMEDMSCSIFDVGSDSSSVFQRINENSSKSSLPGGFTDSKQLLTQLGLIGDSTNQTSYSPEAATAADKVIAQAGDNNPYG